MGKHVDSFTKGRIISLREEGCTFKEISIRILIPRKTCSDIWHKWVKTRSIKRKLGAGYTGKIYGEQKTFIERMIKRDSKFSAEKIREELIKKFNIEVSRQTIKNYLHRIDLFGFKCLKKPFIGVKNIKKRNEICGEWIYAGDSDWKNIVWSDESPFEKINADKRTYCWRKKGEGLKVANLRPTVKKGGGKINVWGCFSYYGVGKLILIHGNMDQFQYLDILRNNLEESFNMMNLSDPVFQQDNDPKHTSKLVKGFLSRCDFDVLVWPSQSPDLNPIEHLWAYVKKRLSCFKAKNDIELFNKIQEIWNSIPLELCQKLVMSMKKRVVECLKVKGGHTKY